MFSFNHFSELKPKLWPILFKLWKQCEQRCKISFLSPLSITVWRYGVYWQDVRRRAPGVASHNLPRQADWWRQPKISPPNRAQMNLVSTRPASCSLNLNMFIQFNSATERAKHFLWEPEIKIELITRTTKIVDFLRFCVVSLILRNFLREKSRHKIFNFVPHYGRLGLSLYASECKLTYLAIKPKFHAIFF